MVVTLITSSLLRAQSEWRCRDDRIVGKGGGEGGGGWERRDTVEWISPKKAAPRQTPSRCECDAARECLSKIKRVGDDQLERIPWSPPPSHRLSSLEHIFAHRLMSAKC